MISSFGQNPATVPTLLQFLTILPEELNNTRIPVTVSASLVVHVPDAYYVFRTTSGKKELLHY